MEISSLQTLTLDACVHEQSRLRPDNLALMHSSRCFTWRELEAVVDAVAGELILAGLRPGGILLAFPRRDWEQPVVFLATVRAGGVFVALSPEAGEAQIDTVVQHGVDVVYVPGNNTLLARRLAQRHPGVVLLCSQGHTGLTLEAMCASRAPGPGPSSDVEAVCYLNLTSGSTGLPKMVKATHANIQWNTRACLERYSISHADRYLCMFAPFSHPHEHWARCVASGAVCVMVEETSPGELMAAIQRHGVTWLFAIPSVFQAILFALRGRFESALRICEFGGSVIPPGLVQRGEAAFGCGFMPIWGCAEASGVVFHVPPWNGDRRVETLGDPLPHYETEVMDTDPISGVGELWIRGPGVASGYIHAEDDGERFADGWYRTGDLVRRDAQGRLWFMGRANEMIKVGGVKVYLSMVEQELHRIPAVRQVAVVGARDPLEGEVLRAVLALKRGEQLTRDGVLAACRASMPSEMVPRIIEFWDALPTTPTGKIDKGQITRRILYPIALAVNSMIIAGRPMKEVFELAAGLRDRTGYLIMLDLRSRRSPASDPEGNWRVAHNEIDFDLGVPESVDRAVELSRVYGIPIVGANPYFGTCYLSDRDYGREMIDAAYHLAEAAPEETMILRVLGGDILARARGMAGRWQDLRRTLRDESINTLRSWLDHSRERAEQTGRKVVLGLEIHHGFYLQSLNDIHHCCQQISSVGWDFFGFIEDPANRFIAEGGDYIDPVDFGRIITAMGGRILSYHIKDVRYLSSWSQFHPQPLQRVGEPVFVWGTHKYEWASIGEGEIDLERSILAAQTMSQPPHPWCVISTEHVPASRSPVEAMEVLQSYVTLLQRTSSSTMTWSGRQPVAT